MDSVIDRMEDNEWSFCSMWAERFSINCATALINKKLEGDYFFNRADVSSCPDPVIGAKQIAKKFWLKDMDCPLYDRDGKLANKGFPQIDEMYVLKASARCNTVDTNIVQIGRPLLPIWINVFCRSFGVPEWKEVVGRIMNSNFRRLVLLLAYREEEPVGCGALYRKHGMRGIYCLGTLSQLRRRGIAHEMLKSIMSNNVFVQTLGSEGLLPLYEKAGFEVVYTKKIYLLRRTTN